MHIFGHHDATCSCETWPQLEVQNCRSLPPFFPHFKFSLQKVQIVPHSYRAAQRSELTLKIMNQSGHQRREAAEAAKQHHARVSCSQIKHSGDTSPHVNTASTCKMSQLIEKSIWVDNHTNSLIPAHPPFVRHRLKDLSSVCKRISGALKSD